MKKIAITVLFLFAASLFGDAFAACVNPAHAAMASAQVRSLSSCCADQACPGGSCLTPTQKAGCGTDILVAVAERGQSASTLAKGFEKTVIPAPVLSTASSAHDAIARVKRRAVKPAGVGGYVEVYARTGRLLI